MKKHLIHLSYFYAITLVFLTSCYPENQPDEVPEEVNLPEMREELGGAPSEVTTQGNGIFFAYDQNCTAGFGWCDVNLAQPDPTTPGGQEPERAQVKRYKATFYMGTKKDTSVLRIEFSEPIPNFGAVFNVGYPDTLYSAFGYEFVVPKVGNYPSMKPSAKLPHGAVEIPVSPGPEQETYLRKEKE